MNSNLVMNTSQCPMCEELQMKEHILKKWDNFATIFNRYPYSIGDIMVIPLQHIDTINNLSKDQRAEFIEAVNISQQLVMKALETDSSNIGLNCGPQSGASIPTHLHMHIIPRQTNDMGFYNTICQKIPESKKVCNDMIRKLFSQI